MTKEREGFFSAIEEKTSSAENLLLTPKELQKKLTEIQNLLESDWPSIFASLNEYPLSEEEKRSLKLLIDRFNMLNKKVHRKLSFFSDFQKYIQVSLEK